MERPYIKYKIQELENITVLKHNDLESLQAIKSELLYRKKRNRVKKLLNKIDKRIELFQSEYKRNISGTVEPKVNYYMPADNNISSIKWDETQVSVIQSGESVYKYIEAGPGTGKTAVACAKVAYLINEKGLSASNILLVSFTRTAIKEIKDRIQILLNENHSLEGLQIYTLDSFTWNVLASFNSDDSENLFSTFEGNIQKLINALEERDDDILEFLSDFEHVLIDEAQDIVGIRSQLCQSIINCVSDYCGITIFADSAQAIYGFTTDEEELGDKNESLLEHIKNNKIANLSRIDLINIHRTQDEKLRALFKDGRKQLIDRSVGTVESWNKLRSFIKNHAHGVIDHPRELDLNNEYLLLYRKKYDVLFDSFGLSKDGVEHSLRMSGVPQRIYSWIGRLISAHQKDELKKEDFYTLWGKNIEANEDTDISEAWDILFNFAGISVNSIDIVRLREILSRTRIPVELEVPQNQLNGPVLSTIHASKGRESSHVVLQLPNSKRFNSYTTSEIFLEEERVLYVGATRARKTLYVSEGYTRWSDSTSKTSRVFKISKPPRKQASVQIGLDGDLNPVHSASDIFGINPKDIQEWLWIHRNKKVELVSKWDKSSNEIIIQPKGSPLIIGSISKQLKNDCWEIADKIGDIKSYRPSSKFNFYMQGVSTYVLNKTEKVQVSLPYQRSGFILIPVITGFPIIKFFKRSNKS